jgi:cytochrome b
LSDLPNHVSSVAAARSDAPTMIQVWDLPLRIFHWALAASVLTAYFSANIFDTVHEIAGYTVLGLIAFRFVWGFTGTRYSRFQSSIQPLRTVLHHLREIVHGRPGRYLGLNPAGAAMSFALLALLAVSAISGWMQITERFFGVDWVEEVHTISSNLVLLLAALHVVGVLLTCALQNENLVRAMISGKKRAAGE